MNNFTIADWLLIAKEQFVESSTPALDAEVLLSYILSVPRDYLFSHPEQRLNLEEELCLKKIIARRAKGEPIAYIVGYKEFWSLDFSVTPNTLIPRPETELLVEIALSLFPFERTCRIVDLGTGSGAVGLAIAKERPMWQIYATESSREALQVAVENARRLNIANGHFLMGDWCEALFELKFDIILSNPPYIKSDDSCLFQGDVRFEPKQALVGGGDGLQDICKIAEQANYHLNSGGYLLFEHGENQANEVRKILLRNGYVDIVTVQDLLRKDRVTYSRKNVC